VELGFDIISVKKMSTTRRSQGSSSTSLPLFLLTILRSEKSQDVYKLTSLCYIAIKVELYKSQFALTQCHNCQQFGHVPVACVVEVATSTGSAQKRVRKIQHRLAAIVSWQKEKDHIHQPTEAAATHRKRCVGRKFQGHLSHVWEESSPPPSRRLYRAKKTKLSKAIQARLQWINKEFRLHRNGRKQISQYRLKS
jgi:hypothetical protein